MEDRIIIRAEVIFLCRSNPKRKDSKGGIAAHGYKLCH